MPAVLLDVHRIQKYGATTLAWAASKGHKQVVDVLLKAGANPDIQDHVR
jgi:ankyrin repeat protein